MTFYVYFLKSFVALALFLYSSAESTNSNKLQENDTANLSGDITSLENYAINNEKEDKMKFQMEKNSIEISLSQDSNLPKCLSFKYEEGGCENIHTFYKNTDTRKSMQLDNLVFIMFIHNDETVDELIKAHFETWIRRVGLQTDIVFVTDEDDPRSFKEVLPDADKVRCNVSLYKSPAKKEGSHLRYKVADAFQHLCKKYQNDNAKEYFVKIDTDTYVLPVALMDLINKIDKATNPQPALFGRLRSTHPDFYYAAGPLYGMNKIGFNAVAKYFSEHEEIFDEIHLRTSGKGNLMVHEDFMTTHVFRQATNYPMTHVEKIFTHLYSHLGYGAEGSSPVCYHRLKYPQLFYVYEKAFFEHGNLRGSDEVEKRMLRV